MSSFSSYFQTLIKLILFVFSLRIINEFKVSESQTVLDYLTWGHISFIWPSRKKTEPVCTGINIVINYFG